MLFNMAISAAQEGKKPKPRHFLITSMLMALMAFLFSLTFVDKVEIDQVPKGVLKSELKALVSSRDRVTRVASTIFELQGRHAGKTLATRMTTDRIKSSGLVKGGIYYLQIGLSKKKTIYVIRVYDEGGHLVLDEEDLFAYIGDSNWASFVFVTAFSLGSLVFAIMFVVFLVRDRKAGKT